MVDSLPTPSGDVDRLDELAKLISDLDAVVKAMLSALAQSKPWQRQLRAHLRQVDREVQVLRLTISLDRELPEVRDAAIGQRHCQRWSRRHGDEGGPAYGV